MSAQTAAAPAAKNSAPNKTAGAKATAAPEYNGNLQVADIVPDGQNRHDATDLPELAASIKAEGLLQPIVVRPCPKFPGAIAVRHVVDKVEHYRVFQGAVTSMANLLYEADDKRDADRAAAIYRSGAGWQIIAGERRWRAHRLNKAETIRGFIHRAETDVSAAVKQTIENLGRKDLNPIEEARQMQRLADLKVPQGEIGKLFGGRSQPVISNSMRLLTLPAKVQAAISEGKLSHAHGVCLAAYAKWSAACEFIAADAIEDEKTAKDLASGLGYSVGQRLQHKKLAAELSRYEFPNHQFPPAVLKDPDVLQVGHSTWCFSWSRYEAIMKPVEDARKAEAAATRAKHAAAKETDKGTVIEKDSAYLAVLLPPEKLGKRGQNLVALDSRRWEEILREAQQQMEAADEKVIKACATEAIELLKKTKGVSAAFVAVLFSDQDTEFNDSAGPDQVLSKFAKEIGIKCSVGRYADLVKVDPMQLVKLQIHARLEDIKNDEGYWQVDDLESLFCAVLGRPKLNFLDETPVGRQTIVEKLAAKLKVPLMQVNGALPPPTKKTKPKKGGRSK